MWSSCNALFDDGVAGMPLRSSTSTVEVGHALRWMTAWMPALAVFGQQFVAEFVFADGADGVAFGAVLHGVVGEVDGAPPARLPVGACPRAVRRGEHDWFGRDGFLPLWWIVVFFAS